MVVVSQESPAIYMLSQLRVFGFPLYQLFIPKCTDFSLEGTGRLTLITP